MLIVREQEVFKLEEQRISGVETQATAILTLIVAIAAFGASSLNSGVLEEHKLAIGAVAFVLLVSAGFAVAARGPRTLKARFWRRIDPHYNELEQELAKREEQLEAHALAPKRYSSDEIAQTVLANWRARTAVSTWLADRKALWLTWALIGLLVAFIATGVAALVVLN